MGIRGYFYGAIALLIAGLGITVVVQTSRMNTAVAEKKLAQRERDEAKANLAVSKINADRMLDEKQDAIAALSDQSVKDAVSSALLTSTLVEIANAPDGNACASSAPVSAVFDSLRKRQTDRQ